MGYRGRIIPNVSYFYTHKRGLGKGQSQEDRAAELVRATVEFKKLVDRCVFAFHLSPSLRLQAIIPLELICKSRGLD